jgi:hypothetical protein
VTQIAMTNSVPMSSDIDASVSRANMCEASNLNLSRPRTSFFAFRTCVRDSGFAERMAKREGLPKITIENCAGLIATDKRV